MKFAAIDIGSNSIHLVIVRAEPGQHLDIIDREKEMVRLGSGTLRAHKLSKQTIERAVKTLRRLKRMAEANYVDLIIATATAPLRESHNADEFIEAVRKEVGLDVQVLPGVEEARLIALAVSEVTDFNGRRALIIDIGGGSTEFIITRGDGPELLLSVRLGAVRLTEKFITTDPISQEERDRLTASIRADLTRAVWEIKRLGFDFVIGTSGTILNMVSAIVQAESAAHTDDHAGFEPFSQTVTLGQLKRMNRRLSSMTIRERGRVPGLEKDRADIVIAGGLLLETILSELGAKEVTSCDWSLREGLILNHLRKHEAEYQAIESTMAPTGRSGGGISTAGSDSDQTDGPLDVRARSVMSVARRYDYDAPHSHHVARLAKRIFDDTQDLHGMGDHERSLLEYAALLHDIGYHIAPNNHHRHSLYLIKNSEMPGFTGNEIAVMAAVVRYHRGSLPKKPTNARMRREHEDLLSVERGHRTTVIRLAAILQIADALDRSHRQLIREVRCEVAGTTATFYLESDNESELELWSADRKARWFREIFRVAVRFESILPAPAQQETAARSGSVFQK